jgi:UDP-2,4-diacetamido-2,4,6-trideoxy-beta-L-altropyranose hydrolase
VTDEINWAFRVASKSIDGGGHINRCLPLAKALQAHANVCFVLDTEGQRWKSVIEKQGFPTRLASDITPSNWQGCLFDGYHFCAEEIGNWRQQTSCITVIDDYCSPPAFAKLAVLPAYSPSTSQINGVECIGGPEHALVAREYAESTRSNPCGSVQSILIGAGFRDGPNLTALALTAIAETEGLHPLPNITVCLGSGAPHLSNLLALSHKLPFDVEFALDQPGIKHLLDMADLVIGGGGVSLLERMASGVPSITAILADNQTTLANWASNQGATINIGNVNTVSRNTLTDALALLLENKQIRMTMSLKAKKLIDGRGPDRIAQVMLDTIRHSG